ncbi:hypothetical protein TNCV_215891 [Trichonephila clavipes]|nr:hypothetical protein TNCV_215891 [Trichonephila clavipes]
MAISGSSSRLLQLQLNSTSCLCVLFPRRCPRSQTLKIRLSACSHPAHSPRADRRPSPHAPRRCPRFEDLSSKPRTRKNSNARKLPQRPAGASVPSVNGWNRSTTTLAACNKVISWRSQRSFFACGKVLRRPSRHASQRSRGASQPSSGRRFPNLLRPFALSVLRVHWTDPIKKSAPDEECVSVDLHCDGCSATYDTTSKMRNVGYGRLNAHAPAARLARNTQMIYV